MRVPPGVHRRYNPLIDEWVLCSPARLSRPWQGQVEQANGQSEARPPNDPACYLCPGNVRANGERNPDYTDTFAFDNDYPALTTRDRGGEPDGENSLLRAERESGICRVVAFSPRHDLSLARMGVDAIERVIDTWADETQRLSAAGMRHVQIFENRGAMAGASNPHPHSQIWSTASVPTIPARKLAAFRRHHSRAGGDLLGDYLEQEIAESERILFASDEWIALVPFWAVWPFETMLIPRQRASSLGALAAAQRGGLAHALQRLVSGYDAVFQTEFPYSMGVAQAPTDGADHPEWRLHLTFQPPLLRSASVRKFLTGYELSAEPQRDITPEEAAERLRAADRASSGRQVKGE